MNSKKKKKLAATVVVLCLCIVAMCVAAYAIYKGNPGKTHNVITTGGIDIELNAFGHSYDDENSALIPVDPVSDVAILPGVTISRAVTVENLDEPAYIRVRFVLKFADGSQQELSAGEAAKLFTVTPGDMVVSDNNVWARNPDDPADPWFYFNGSINGGKNGVVPNGATIGALEVDVTCSPNMGNEYNGAGYTACLTIEAQAVQYVNQGEDLGNGEYSGVDDPWDAAGWPDTSVPQDP